MAAIYAADCWCDSCAEDIKNRITKEDAESVPKDLTNESSWNSDSYPKYMEEDSESDSPQHCGSGEDCLEAEVLPSGRKIGKLLSRELTFDGIDYVKEKIQEGGEVAEFWRQEFESAGIDFELEKEEDADDEN